MTAIKEMDLASRNVQKGVGLTEVMVALLLLSVAVLGFIGLQVRASAAGNEAFARTQAMAIAQDMAERVRLNIAQIAAYTTAANWAGTSSKTACEIVACGAAALVQYDIANVKNSASTLLPAGQVSMQLCPGSQLNCIFVSWDDTTPTVGAADTDCVTAAGRYRDGATCVMMEAY